MRGGDQVRAAASARQVEGGRRCPRFEAHRACSDIVAQSRERQHSRRHLPGRQASRLCGGPPRCSAVARLSWSQKTRERATSAHRQPPCTHTTHTYTRASTKTEVLTRQVTWFPLASPPPFREYALACRCVSQSQPRRQGVYVEITHWAFSVVGGGWCAHTGMSRCRSLEQGESREGGRDDLGDDVLA